MSRRERRNEREAPTLLILMPSADGYGSDRALVAALDAIVERFEVTIVFAADGPLRAEAARSGATVVMSPDWALRRRFFTPRGIVPALARVGRTVLLVRRLDRQHQFDLVYANTVANAMLPFVHLATKAPVVVHVREVPRTSGRLNSVFFGLVDRVAASLICNSTSTAAFVERSVGAGLDGDPRVVVVHDGVEPGEVAEPGPNSAPLEIVCVGRIHPQKGQGVMIEALRLATLAGHDWRLHVRGDALPEHQWLADELRLKVAEAGLAGRVVWHGYEADTTALYRGMHVAVVPSTWPEGFSLVAAEAQAAGLPVVATGPGGPSDIIEEGVTGRIVPFDDPAAFVGALAELEDAELRRSWGAAARSRATELFSTERYAAGLVGVLESLVQRAAGSSADGSGAPLGS